MARWRLGQGWSSATLGAELLGLRACGRTAPSLPLEELTMDRGWRAERAGWLLGHEPPGSPVMDGPFERIRAAIERYDFSDPDIVEGHFDRQAPLVGRDMLLELKVVGTRFLCGVRVVDAGALPGGETTGWGFRYDTLEGHVERGGERFRVTKEHASGAVYFSIESRWQRGELPTWWSRIGFGPMAFIHRRLWMRRAAVRLREVGFDVPERTTASVIGVSAALGALTGVRSSAGPLVVAAHSVRTGARVGAGRVERGYAQPATTALLALGAVGEVAADKHPAMPPRSDPLALSGRVLAATLAARTLAKRAQRPPVSAMAVSGAAAVVTATLASGLRGRLTSRRWRISTLLGWGEDLLVLGGSLALYTALGRRRVPLEPHRPARGRRVSEIAPSGRPAEEPRAAPELQRARPADPSGSGLPRPAPAASPVDQR